MTNPYSGIRERITEIMAGHDWLTKEEIHADVDPALFAESDIDKQLKTINNILYKLVGSGDLEIEGIGLKPGQKQRWRMVVKKAESPTPRAAPPSLPIETSKPSPTTVGKSGIGPKSERLQAALADLQKVSVSSLDPETQALWMETLKACAEVLPGELGKILDEISQFFGQKPKIHPTYRGT